MNHYRQIIINNNLQEFADKINISENYKILLKGISEGKNGVQISKDIGCSNSRIRDMYFQYVKWCREYTGLKYFEDCPPISREKYDELWIKQKGKFRTAPEIEEAIKKEINENNNKFEVEK